MRFFLSKEGESMYVEENHYIFKFGIFSLISDGEKVDIPYNNLLALCLNFFPKPLTFDWLLDHLKYIEQFSYESHERKCAQKIIGIVIKNVELHDNARYIKNIPFIFSKLCILDLKRFKIEYYGFSRPDNENKFKIQVYDIFSFCFHLRKRFAKYIMKNMSVNQFELFFKKNKYGLNLCFEEITDFVGIKLHKYVRDCDKDIIYKTMFIEFIMVGNLEILDHLMKNYLNIEQIKFLYEDIGKGWKPFSENDYKHLLNFALLLQSEKSYRNHLIEKLVLLMAERYTSEKLNLPEDFYMPIIHPSVNTLFTKNTNPKLNMGCYLQNLATFSQFYIIPNENIHVDIPQVV